MKRNYSRLARVEESKNMRMAFVFGIGAILIVVLLIVFGIPAVTGIVGYLSNMKNKPSIINEDKTPPGPPFLKPLPEASNKERLDIEGTAEPDATILIFVNDEKEETKSDSSGAFSTEVTLTKGQNEIYAKAKDSSGNESVNSTTYNVFYSKEKPTLEVSKPSQGDKYFGDKQKQLQIEGKTCVDCSIAINGRFAPVDDEGNFKLTYGLNEGNNDLNIIATDKAGNTEETTISVEFTP